MSGTVVIGATGGCGVTTIACAIALSQSTGQAVPVLVDADLHRGGPGALWSMDAARGMDDLVALGSDVDAGHAALLVHRHACGVDVLAGCSSAGSPVVHDSAACEAIAAHVSSRGSWVADGGRGDARLCASLVARADRVLVVAPCTLQGAARSADVVARLGGRPFTGIAARWCPGERVASRVLARFLGAAEVLEIGKDDRGASDVASARMPRGRGLARAIARIGVA